MNGSNVQCARCVNGYTVDANGACISTPDGKCLDNTDAFTTNGYCNTCNYYSGFYAVKSLSSGTQLCSNGDGSEFNAATTTNTNNRPDINGVIRQSVPGFGNLLGFGVLILGFWTW